MTDLTQNWREHALPSSGPKARFAELYRDIAAAIGYDLRDIGFIALEPTPRAPVLSVGPDLTADLGPYLDDFTNRRCRVVIRIAEQGDAPGTLSEESVRDMSLEIGRNRDGGEFILTKAGRGHRGNELRVQPADLGDQISQFIETHTGPGLHRAVTKAITAARTLQSPNGPRLVVS